MLQRIARVFLVVLVSAPAAHAGVRLSGMKRRTNALRSHGLLGDLIVSFYDNVWRAPQPTEPTEPQFHNFHVKPENQTALPDNFTAKQIGKSTAGLDARLGEKSTSDFTVQRKNISDLYIKVLHDSQQVEKNQTTAIPDYQAVEQHQMMLPRKISPRRSPEVKAATGPSGFGDRLWNFMWKLPAIIRTSFMDKRAAAEKLQLFQDIDERGPSAVCKDASGKCEAPVLAL